MGRKRPQSKFIDFNPSRAIVIHIYSRSLGLEDWKKANPTMNVKKFDYYWRRLASDKREVCRPPLRLILSNAVGALDQEYKIRQKELVRFNRLRY